MIEFLAWLTVVGLPLLVILFLIYLLLKWMSKMRTTTGYEPPQYEPTWKSTETTIKSEKKPPKPKPPKPPKPDKSPPSSLPELNVEFPKITGLDEESWNTMNEFDVDSRKIVNPGTRVYRIYRSLDQLNWAECDPALTERAACNYAQYIKMQNPNEFVRCNDPEGLILSYE